MTSATAGDSRPETSPSLGGVTTLRVVSKEIAAERVVTLRLAAADGARLPDWTPGAHIDVVLPNGATRQYSLCGDRWDPASYRIGVLLEPASNGGSRYVHQELQIGDLVGVGGPRNNFPMVPADEYLFIAGGIGITPLLPMVHQASMLGIKWRLLYAGRHRASMAFLGTLADYGDLVQVAAGDESGRADLHGFLDTPRPGAKVYVCGPPGLLTAAQRATADWPPHTLRTERFAAVGAVRATRTAAFQVELARTGGTVTVAPGTSILDAVGGAGVQVLSSCRRGVCGTCETAVLDGSIDHRDALLEDHERAANDRMFICVSRSLGDRLVLDL